MEAPSEAQGHSAEREADRERGNTLHMHQSLHRGWGRGRQVGKGFRGRVEDLQGAGCGCLHVPFDGQRRQAWDSGPAVGETRDGGGVTLTPQVVVGATTRPCGHHHGLLSQPLSLAA
jgi:hypothetical protein